MGKMGKLNHLGNLSVMQGMDRPLYPHFSYRIIVLMLESCRSLRYQPGANQSVPYGPPVLEPIATPNTEYRITKYIHGTAVKGLIG